MPRRLGGEREALDEGVVAPFGARGLHVLALAARIAASPTPRRPPRARDPSPRWPCGEPVAARARVPIAGRRREVGGAFRSFIRFVTRPRCSARAGSSVAHGATSSKGFLPAPAPSTTLSQGRPSDAFNHAVDPVGPQELAVEGGGLWRRAVFDAMRRYVRCRCPATGPSSRAAPRERHSSAAAARPRRQRCHHARHAPASPAWIASSSVRRSETSVTDRDAASVISPAGSRSASFSTSAGASRFPRPGRRAIRALDRGALLLARASASHRAAAGQPPWPPPARRCARGPRTTDFWLPFELGKHHERDRVLGQPRAPCLDRLAALRSRLAGGNAQLHQPLRREERHVGRGRADSIPVHAGLGEEHLALGAAVLARRLADAVGGLQREEGLRAVHRVEGRHALPEVALELARGNLHATCPAWRWRSGAGCGWRDRAACP